jgi:hypothetical protein
VQQRDSAATSAAKHGAPGCQLVNGELRPGFGGVERTRSLLRIQGARRRAALHLQLLTEQPLQAYSTWASSAIQLDRVGQGVHAPTTVSKTSTAVRRILGFGIKVLLQNSTPGLHDMLNGDLLASYTSFALDIRCALMPSASPGSTPERCCKGRHNKPSSVATDVGEALHIQQYLLSKATNADEKADIAALQARAPPLNTTPAPTHRGMLLQDCTRLLCNQLRALPSDKRSIEELRQAGEYVDLAELWLQIDTFLAELDYSEHTEVNARRIHDALMLLLCFREHPITRPTCIRLLLVPGVLLPCNLCNVPGCMGNSWSGRTAVIRHYKTSGTYGSHSITVLEGSKTEQVLKEYICWARPMLLKDTSSHALFLTRYGKPFIRDGCFNKYLPRLLQSLSGAKLSWTKARAAGAAAPPWGGCQHSHCTLRQLRHITANGLVPLATAEQLEGLAACMQTRCAPRRAPRGTARCLRNATARASSPQCTRTTAGSTWLTWGLSCTSQQAALLQLHGARRARRRARRRMSFRLQHLLRSPLLMCSSNSSLHWYQCPTRWHHRLLEHGERVFPCPTCCPWCRRAASAPVRALHQAAAPTCLSDLHLQVMLALQWAAAARGKAARRVTCASLAMPT